MTSSLVTNGLIETIRASSGAVRRAIGNDLEPKHLGVRLYPGGSHLMWLIGHLAWTADMLMNRELGHAPILPDHYAGLFQGRTKALDDLTTYPSLDDVLKGYDVAHQLALERLTNRDDALLDVPFNEGTVAHKIFTVPRAMLGRMAFHIGYHGGQISTLRRMQGLPSVFGS